MANKIHIGNLPFKITEADLETAFSKFGEIANIALIKDRDTGRLKGFGFIEFISADAAKESLSLDGTDLLGRPIRVSLARDRQDNGGGSGGRGGRPSHGGGQRRFNSRDDRDN